MIFTLIGLVIASGICGMIGLAGLFHMLFNDIGGNGSKSSVLAGFAVMCAGFYAAYWLWAEFSPLRIMIAA